MKPPLEWSPNDFAITPDGTEYMIQREHPLHEPPFYYAMHKPKHRKGDSLLLRGGWRSVDGDEHRGPGAKARAKRDAERHWQNLP